MIAKRNGDPRRPKPLGTPVTSQKRYYTQVPDPHLPPGITAWRRQAKDGVLLVHTGYIRKPEGHAYFLNVMHPRRIPSWEELTQARYAFVPEMVPMAILFPPRAGYTDVHPFAVHFHEVAEYLESSDPSPDEADEKEPRE